MGPTRDGTDAVMGPTRWHADAVMGPTPGGALSRNGAAAVAGREVRWPTCTS
jgi:hypothetical protein